MAWPSFSSRPYVGANGYKRTDKKYRSAYRPDDDFCASMTELYGAFYGTDYNGLKYPSEFTAEASYANFLGDLKNRLPHDPHVISHKLTWASLEYYFASAKERSHKKLLSFDYKFYCASALAALDTLILYCDEQSSLTTPYIFIATTQLPNEYFSLSSPGFDSGNSYDVARQTYAEAFRNRIAQRGEKNLIVERHTFVTRDAGDFVPLVGPDLWKTGPEGEELELNSSDVDNALLTWLNGNHHWRVAADKRSPINCAYINEINLSHLPKDGVPSQPIRPRDDCMCIDLIAFGGAESTGLQHLAVDWRFAIGVFSAARPTDLQGRSVRLFSHDDLMNTTRKFPFLGYNISNFKTFVSAVHGSGAEERNTSDLRPGTSRRVIDVKPWMDWAPELTSDGPINRIFQTVTLSHLTAWLRIRRDMLARTRHKFTTGAGLLDSVWEAFIAIIVGVLVGFGLENWVWAMTAFVLAFVVVWALRNFFR